ncbi:hypothetical protein PV327_011001 [Microctonus hyperodae]|uniref:Disks large-associated protein 5 n=1 Tax=Microctonus hyperodae TaxID=165561 RepID=A0AA39C809_MICHY|nr:hypothetical protein PV327_011001 [Microctonus hyperodae]
MNRTNQYKQRHVPFGSAGARMVRAQEIADRRKERRDERFSRFRNDSIEKNDINEAEFKPETREDRMTRLQKWKAERNLKKKLESKNKQPVFKVGVPHSNLFSPSSNSPVVHCHRKKNKECKHNQPTPPKRVTRATEKRLAAKQVALLQKEESININAVESKKNVKIKKMKEKKVIKNETVGVTAIAPSDYEFKGPSGIINPLPMFGRIWIPLSEKLDNEKIKSEGFETPPKQYESGIGDGHVNTCDSSLKKLPQEINVDKVNDSDETRRITRKTDIEQNVMSTVDPEEDINNVSKTRSPLPAEFSPYITTTRGKRSARKEQRRRLGLNNSLGDDIPTKDNVMQNLNISIEEEEKTAQYYKILLKQQIERLTGVCTNWEKIQSEPGTTEDGRYMINQAIGQANLLMRKKFERFRGLVLDCETGKGEMLVRCRDLQAFWDIILMQIKDCDARFDKLSEMQKKNWIEEDTQSDQVLAVKKKTNVGKKNKIVAKSSARAFIEAARKKKLLLKCDVNTKQEEDEVVKPDTTMSEMKSLITPQSKTRSMKKGDKLLDTSFTVMKVSHMGKTPEVKLDNTISYVNSDQTPGKGILKKSEGMEKDDMFQMKSIFKVNFNETVSTNEQLLDKGDIENFVGAEKRLDFDDASFNEDNHHVVVCPDVVMNSSVSNIDKISTKSNIKYEEDDMNPNHLLPISANESITNTQNVKKLKTKSQLSNVSLNDSSLLNARVLRNRAMIKSNTPTKIRRISKKHNSSVSNLIKNTEDDDTAKENEVQVFNQRRSTRRSVKFDVAEDCTACVMSKPTLPMTPRRNKKLSLFGITNSRESVVHVPANGDLMSFDSPITPRRRS